MAIEWYPYSKEHRDRFVVDFNKLYVETILPALLAADPRRCLSSRRAAAAWCDREVLSAVWSNVVAAGRQFGAMR